MNVTARGARGMRWQALVTVVAQVVQALATFAVAGLTSPKEFALWGIAAVFFNVQFLVGSLGLGQALIYHRHDEAGARDAVDAAFIATTALAVGLAVLGIACAGLLPSLLGPGFASGDVVDVVRLMSIVLFFNVVANVPQALIEKTLDFRRRALPDLAGSLLYLVTVAVGLVAGAGVWSLIWGRLAQAVVWAILFWRAAPIRPRARPKLVRPVMAELFHFAKYVTAAGLVTYLIGNADTISVGAIAGAGALGAYSLAYTVTNLAPTFLTQTLGKVYFPLYAAVRHDPIALRHAYSNALAYLTVLMLPVTTGLMLFGGDALVSVFGDEWRQAEGLLRILAVYGLARTVGSAANVVQSGTGRADVVFATSLVVLAASLFALWLLAGSGVAGVAWAFTAGQIVGAGFAAVRTSGLWSHEMLAAMAPATLCTVTAAFAGEGVTAVLDGNVGAVAAAVVFPTVYVTGLLIADNRSGGTIRTLLRPA